MKPCLLFLFSLLLSISGFSQVEKNIYTGDNVLHYKTFGTGTAVLIINGGPGMSSEGFTALAESLGKNNHAIIYDQRGAGKSQLKEISSETISMDLMAQDIEVLRKELQIDSWVVFGHSFGGMLASYYTAKHPDHTLGLVLSSSGGLNLDLLSSLNITARLSEIQRDSLQYWNNRISEGDNSYAARFQRGKYLAPAYLYDQSLVPLIAERLTQGNRTINSLVWSDLRNMDFDCTETLATYTKPVLIIQGENDIIGKEIALKSAGVLSNSEVVFIEKCAHYGWLEQPDSYFGAIFKFLKKFES